MKTPRRVLGDVDAGCEGGVKRADGPAGEALPRLRAGRPLSAMMRKKARPRSGTRGGLSVGRAAAVLRVKNAGTSVTRERPGFPPRRRAPRLPKEAQLTQERGDGTASELTKEKAGLALEDLAGRLCSVLFERWRPHARLRRGFGRIRRVKRYRTGAVVHRRPSDVHRASL